MENRDVIDYIKGSFKENLDEIEGLNGDSKFINQFNDLIDKKADDIYSKMEEIKGKINLQEYSAVFIISKNDLDISYCGIFNTDDLDYPKFDKESYYQFCLGVV